MKDGFRQSMAWLHTQSGLLAGWILYFIFVTGTAGYFDTEIDRWMRPELPMAGSIATSEAVALGVARLEQVAPGASRWTISLPDRDTHPGVELSWRNPPVAGRAATAVSTEMLDGSPSEPLKPRQTGGGQLLYQMHWGLWYLPQRIAYWTVGICAMLMFVGLITGVIAHRKIFREFFTFRPGRGRRSWLDAHNVFGVMALPFHIMITYSGLVFFMFTYLPLVLEQSDRFDEQDQRLFFADSYARSEQDTRAEIPERAGIGAPLAALGPMLAQAAQRGGKPLTLRVINPGDLNSRVIVVYRSSKPQSASERLIFDGSSGELLAAPSSRRSAPKAAYEVLLGLHEGIFAGTVLRWLYFLSGLLSAAMIATGLIFWTVKRRAKHSAGRALFGVFLVERLNAGTIVGLPIGVAAYFWANRLLPVDFYGRDMWEVHALFGAWGLMLLYAACRPHQRAWFELFCVAAALYGLLPLLNAVTTHRHLGVTLPYDHWRGDWALAGFDLTMLAFGLLFWAIAYRIWKKLRAAQPLQRQIRIGPALNMQIEVPE